jgi:hypothetical protein
VDPEACGQLVDREPPSVPLDKHRDLFPVEPPRGLLTPSASGVPSKPWPFDQYAQLGELCRRSGMDRVSPDELHYRIISTIAAGVLLIVVVTIGHRREVYDR